MKPERSDTWLGLDLGGTKLLGVAWRDGHVIAQVHRPTGRATSPSRALELLCEVRSELPDARGVGIGFPGLVQVSTGLARSSVMLDGWRDVPLARLLEERLGLPVVIDNDVNMAAIAEYRLHDVDGPLLHVAVGTGIGAALVTDRGEVWRGHRGFAGELGNTVIREGSARCWCGRHGCVNTLASGTALEQELGLAPGELRRAPSALLGPALWRAGEHLGEAIANAVQLFDPQVVTIGGGLVHAGPELIAATRERVLREVFSEIAQDLVIEPAHAGLQAAAVGAALSAASRHPSP